MKILVIRRDNIGDLVCATPLLAALRHRYRQAHLAVLANSYNAGVLAGNPDIDAVHAYTKLKHRVPGASWLGTLLATAKLLRALRRQRFDYIVLAKSGFDKHGLALARRIRPRHIVGFADGTEPGAPAISLPVAPARYTELHEVEVMMQLAARLDAQAPPGPLRVFASPKLVDEYRSRFPRLLLRDKTWIAVHISAREPGRIWPAERFAQLIDLLGRRHSARIALLWAPGDADDPRHPGDDARAASIVERSQLGGDLVAVPTRALEELAAILSLTDAFIGPDGGAMHLAAGLGLPMVALFERNPYKMRHWHPWQVPHEMVAPATRDIADIPVEDVERAWVALRPRLRIPAGSTSR